MDWNFETLTLENYPPYASKAFEWYQNHPGFLNAFSTFSNIESEFIEFLTNGALYIGKENGEFKAMVFGEILSPEVIEGHLFSSPEVSEDFIHSLVAYAKNISLRHYEMVTTHILAKHKFLKKVMYRTGFIDTGMRSWMAVYRNRLMEVHYYAAMR